MCICVNPLHVVYYKRGRVERTSRVRGCVRVDRELFCGSCEHVLNDKIVGFPTGIGISVVGHHIAGLVLAYKYLVGSVGV